MEISMTFSSFMYPLKIVNYRPPYSVPLRNMCLFILHIKGCFVQVLRHLESSGRTCQCDESSCSDRSSICWMAFWSRSLGKGLHSQWRSQRLLLGNGTLLCHCKSSRPNENILWIVTVLCLAPPRFPRVLHSGVNEVLSFLPSSLGGHCRGDCYRTDGCTLT